MQITALLAVLLAAAGANAAICPNARGIDNFKPETFLGSWYEIKSSFLIYTTFERGCSCVRATYSLLPEEPVPTIRVENQCFRNGAFENILGKAVISAERPSELTVSFGEGFANFFQTAFGTNYRVVRAINDSNGIPQHVLIGSTCNAYLWLLSRQKAPPASVVSELTEWAKNNRFRLPVLSWRDTVQNCDN